uniref:EGF-like domain-containing protein n=1 Tax=Tetraodon nigroviridis TaxID=99883 RepID=H3BWA3_TETNG
CSSNPCRNGGTCLNLLNSYHCLCPSNWEGPDCATDVNECQLFSGKAQGCQNGATCVNGPGSFTCTCSPEWSGSLCTVRYDDCRNAAQDLCVHGTCIDADRVTPGQVAHRFPTGFSCEQLDPPAATCSSNPGSSPSNIFEGSNIPICTCPEGYIGNGYGPSGCTQTSNICQTSSPCVHGQCVVSVDLHLAFSSAPGYICICNSGWQGVNCEQNINECASSPCLNGGTCSDGVNGFTCSCTAQWTGPLCQT